MRDRTIALTLALAVTPLPALAGEVDTMHGRCVELFADGHDLSKGCVGRVMNMNPDNGKTAFVFSLTTGAFFVFEGIGTHQVKVRDVVTQPLTGFTFSLGIAGVKPNVMKATGSCRYSNPEVAGAALRCSAITSHGKFEARFVSDGSALEQSFN